MAEEDGCEAFRSLCSHCRYRVKLDGRRVGQRSTQGRIPDARCQRTVFAVYRPMSCARQPRAASSCFAGRCSGLLADRRERSEDRGMVFGRSKGVLAALLVCSVAQERSAVRHGHGLGETLSGSGNGWCTSDGSRSADFLSFWPAPGSFPVIT